MCAVHTRLHKGFTLVELVIVIILLSVIGVMTSSYIGIGVDLYTDITERDKELNSIRFVMERLRREAANALPNSATVEKYDDTDTDGWCLTFTPIIASSIYGSDFPIFPLSGSSGSVATISNYTAEEGDKAVVYLLELTEEGDIPTSVVNEIDHENTTSEILAFSTSDADFALASPAKRVYIIRNNISYFFNENDELRRGAECTTGVLMAEDITGSFAIEAATLQRNGLVRVSYNLDFDGQEVPIEQTLHINNVP